MNKVLIILFILVFSSSCKSNLDNDSAKNIKENRLSSKTDIEDTSKLITEKSNNSNYEVAYLDFDNSRLQRVFVSIDSVNIYDTLFIQTIICEIDTLYSIDKKSNISFFTDKKYADYKTSLFIDEGHPLPSEEYENWMNYYYLAEYEFETNVYKTYPSCRKDCRRQKSIIIKCE